MGWFGVPPWLGKLPDFTSRDNPQFRGLVSGHWAFSGLDSSLSRSSSTETARKQPAKTGKMANIFWDPERTWHPLYSRPWIPWMFHIHQYDCVPRVLNVFVEQLRRVPSEHHLGMVSTRCSAPPRLEIGCQTAAPKISPATQHLLEICLPSDFSRVRLDSVRRGTSESPTRTTPASS